MLSDSLSVGWRKAFISMLVGSLSACATLSGTGQRDFPEAGGAVELAPNTEPRFVHYGRSRAGEIGVLRPIGNNVFVNGRQVTTERKLVNNDFVNTGPESAVRIDFLEAISGACRIGILDMGAGRGWGNTSSCRHQVETSHAEGRTIQVPTVHHLDVDGWRTQITIIRGQMEARLRNDPARRVVINASEEALFTLDRIIGPRPVSQAEIRERTRWRDGFDFYRQGQDSDMIGKAAAAIIGGLLLKQALDDDDEPDRGSPQDLITVPGVTDQWLEAAASTLKQYNLNLGRITDAQSGQQLDSRRIVYAHYWVLRQRPAPGEQVRPSDTVDLWVEYRYVR